MLRAKLFRTAIIPFLLLPVTSLQSAPEVLPGVEPKAPPSNPPVQSRAVFAAEDGPLPGPGPTLWSIGQPTDEEQLYLEYINRSRANPPAEGIRLAFTTDPAVRAAYDYFGVDTNLLISQFNAISPVPPLAMNAQLVAAARWQSGDMFTNEYQGHYQTNGMGPGERMTAMGYNWITYGENVYSYAESVWQGHAGFNVDWGYGPGGMQTPPGHRNTIHNGSLREVGVGIVNGVNGSVGPQLVTQDFGTRVGATPMITGVVFYDFNTNGFYDLGEGIGGVTVSVSNSAYYSVTADSGGYAVPVSSNGGYAVNFSASGLAVQKTAVISSLQNAKVDYVPTYSPPVVSGPAPAFLNQGNLYNFSAVGASTGYQWQQAVVSPCAAVEGAENGLAQVTVVSSPGYSVLASDVKYAGSWSFHLAHPPDPSAPVDQSITLNGLFLPGTASQLSFYKRLGYAASSQVARAQVSADGGRSWQDLWSQAGNDGFESAFTPVTVSLTAYAGRVVQLRFLYDYIGGSFYPQTSAGVGLYVDNIAVSNAECLLNLATASIAGTSFSFTPTVVTNYVLRVRAQINSRTLDWGPVFRTSAVTPPPVLTVVTKPVVTSGQVQAEFTVANYRSGMTFELWKAGSPAGVWAKDTSATFQTVVADSRFRFTTTTGGASQGYYRVKALY
jgi:hypothetical protein